MAERGHRLNLRHSDTAKARVYHGTGGRDETFARVVELLTEDTNAAVQVSLLPEGDGFLIRAWPPNELHEFGGGNGTALSVVLRVRGDDLVIDQMNVHPQRSHA